MMVFTLFYFGFVWNSTSNSPCNQNSLHRWRHCSRSNACKTGWKQGCLETLSLRVIDWLHLWKFTGSSLQWLLVRNTITASAAAEERL